MSSTAPHTRTHTNTKQLPATTPNPNITTSPPYHGTHEKKVVILTNRHTGTEKSSVRAYTFAELGVSESPDVIVIQQTVDSLQSTWKYAGVANGCARYSEVSEVLQPC